MTQGRAVVAHNVLAMRSEPSDRSEQVSQALLGETVQVLEATDDLVRIETPDGYRGWSLRRHLAILETGERYPSPGSAAMVSALFLPVYRSPDGRSERVTLLTLGTTIQPVDGEPAGDFAAIRLPTGETCYAEVRSLIVPEYPSLERLGPNLIVVARGMIGVPYLWGGRSTFGIDCSAFVQKVYWLCGHALPRDAYLQAQAENVAPVEKERLEAGDLVFFAGARDPRKRTITHVGMALGDGRFIHASGQLGVAITSLDAPPYDREYHSAARLKGA